MLENPVAPEEEEEEEGGRSRAAEECERLPKSRSQKELGASASVPVSATELNGALRE